MANDSRKQQDIWNIMTTHFHDQVLSYYLGQVTWIVYDPYSLSKNNPIYRIIFLIGFVRVFFERYDFECAASDFDLYLHR